MFLQEHHAENFKIVTATVIPLIVAECAMPTLCINKFLIQLDTR